MGFSFLRTLLDFVNCASENPGRNPQLEALECKIVAKEGL